MPAKSLATRFSQAFALLAVMLFVLTITLLVTQQEPRFKGNTATQWLKMADRDPHHLYKYGEIFVSWEGRGARFLTGRIRNNVSPFKRRVADLYNSVAPRIGLPFMRVIASNSERLTARRLLGYFEEQAVNPLTKLLDDPDDANRIAAIQAMSELGPGTAAELSPLLIPLLN